MIPLFATLLLLQVPAVPAPDGVKVANERIFLHTEAGSIVIALYPEVAPRHVNQLLRWVQAGIYNGTCFPRIERNFVIQLSAAEFDRQPPLSASQRALIQPIPAEFSKIKHVRGVVSMARKDGDINSATTSFSILLGAAPHLDEQYTIVGHVEYGMDVVDELVKAPVAGNVPRQRLKVLQAGIVTADQLLKQPPEPARVIFQPSADAPINQVDPEMLRSGNERHSLFTVGLLLIIACLLAPVFLPKINLKQAQTFNLMAVLIAAFLIVAINYDFLQMAVMTNTGYVVAIAIFFGLLGVFRLMSSFESAS